MNYLKDSVTLQSVYGSYAKTPISYFVWSLRYCQGSSSELSMVVVVVIPARRHDSRTAVRHTVEVLELSADLWLLEDDLQNSA